MDIEEVIISSKYSYHINVFLPDSITKLSKYIGIDNHLISLVYNCISMF